VSGDAKWANIEFTPQKYTYLIGVEFKVKENTEPGEELNLHYRSWFVDAGEYTRIPIDSELGNAEETQSKQALYAETINLGFGEGVDADCGQDICYGKEWVFDNYAKEMQRQGTEDYFLTVNKDYNLNFELKNNSGFRITAPKISITGSDAEYIEFKKIWTKNMSGEQLQNTNNITAIELTGIADQETMEVNVLFTPKSEYLTYIDIEFEYGFEQVFTETIWLDTSFGKEMVLELTPETIAAFEETRITVRAASENMGVAGAEIEMAKTLAGGQTIKQRTQTNENGEAIFELPKSSPGTTLVFTAQKIGYCSEPVEMQIAPNAFTVEPDSLESAIDTKFRTSETLEAKISNQTAANILIENAQLYGDFAELLNTEEMQEFLDKLKGTEISAMQEKQMQILKTQVKENIEITEDKIIEAELLLSFKEPDTGMVFDIALPVQIKIDFIADAAMNCIQVNKQEWAAITQNNTATLELELTNNCTIGNEAIKIDKLLAKTVWDGKASGVLEFVETEGFDNYFEAMGEGEWQIVYKDFWKNDTMKAKIVFTPKENTLGETAKFKIIFNGKVETENGSTLVGETEINSEIEIVGLEDCLKIEPDKLTIRAETDSVNFSIDASECKHAIQISLCRNDNGCSGGSSEGTISLSATTLNLTPSGNKATITATKGEIPGIYGITIDAKTQNSEWNRVKTIDVFIEPDNSVLFSMDKYTFALIGIGAKDSATVYNPNLTVDVSVVAPISAWYGSTNNANDFFDPDVAGTGSVPQQLKDAQEAAKIAKDSLQSMSDDAYTEADNARNLTDQALQRLNNAKNQADQADNQAGQVLDMAGQGASLASMLLSDCSSVETAVAGACAKIPPNVPCCTAKATAASMCKTVQAISIAGMAAKAAAGAASQAAQQGAQNAQQGQNLGNMGQQSIQNAEAGACSIEGISDRSRQGSGEARQAAQELANAAQQMQQDEQKMNNAAGELGKVGTQVAEMGAKLAVAKTMGTTISTQCSEAAGAVTAYLARVAALEGVKTGLSSASAAAKSQAETAGQAANNANNASRQAEQQNNNASDNLDRLSVVEVNTQEASSYGHGRVVGILGSYVGLGAMVGSYEGNAYNMTVENCGQMFESILPAFITNLKDDKEEVLVEKEGIEGEWNTEEAKVFGEYESQTAGVTFANNSITGEDAVYTTISLRALRHSYADPTTVGAGSYAGAGTGGSNSGSSFGPFNVPDQAQPVVVEQKFHVKFTTREQKAKPAAERENTCVQGARFGATGEEALPKVKFTWSWHDNAGVSQDSCIAENTEAFYCDATQFSIMISKRLKGIQEFAERNAHLDCPTNQAIEGGYGLKWIVEEFNNYLLFLSRNPIPTNLEEINPECWLPKTTFLFDDKPAINYFVEESDNVAWTSEITSAEELDKLIRFNAYLIRDGYSDDFKSDFAGYYEKASFLNAPDWFIRNPAGQLSDYFRDAEKLVFAQEYLDSTELNNAGLFAVLLNIDFGEGWEFFDEESKPDAKIRVELDYRENPENESIFYYLPFNANLAQDLDKTRQGYGIRYLNEEIEFPITSASELFVTTREDSSGGLSRLSTKTAKEIKTTNSTFSKRGLLLEIKESSYGIDKELLYYPTFATPIILAVDSTENPSQFSAYYQLLDSKTPKTTGETLAFWTGTGENCDNFDGYDLLESFYARGDRYAEELDLEERPSDAYALDWKNAEGDGKIYLKTIFYTPTQKSFAIGTIEESQGTDFRSPDSGFQTSVDLAGISGSLYNNKQEEKSITQLEHLFELVKEGDVCLTDNQTETVFWWNEQALIEKRGTNGSIQEFENSINCN
ncbi:MAG: hypothetical protein JW772_04640, partial [Candidatus Diapherotrites archaeon]|nr:hypothetical protein [Candidatus Diapherotrites archaeon]